MGLAKIGAKAVLAAFFVWAAIYTYSIGLQRGALEDGRADETGVLNSLRGEAKRAELLASMQADPAGDYVEDIQALALRMPADEVPYEASMTRASANFDPVAAGEFAQLAGVFQPRSLIARLHAMSQAAFRGETDQVIRDYERLVELRSLDRNVLADAVVGVFRGSGDWSALIDYVSTQPDTGSPILRRLMNERVDVEALESLIALYPDYQANYLNRLVRDRMFDEAYSAWQLFSNLDEPELANMPFNPNFEDRSEAQPFNWAISQDRAEFQGRGGLYITYLGTERPRMAHQITSAAPGEYMLRTEALGRMPENGGSLEWTFRCVDSRTRLAVQRVDLKTINQEEVFETRITIPDADCAYQYLELWGRSGEFPKTSRTEVLSVELIPVVGEG